MAELTITRVFEAPRELVWRAWTDPVQIAQWWGPRGISTPLDKIHLDLRPGGAASLVMVDDATGEEYPNTGTYLEVVPPERLVWHDDGFADGSGAGTVTITFVDLGDATELTVHAVADFSDTVRAQAEIGWGSSFDKLAEFLAAARA
jgi:uncharacterized protein YndB with AHSA1/START domain